MNKMNLNERIQRYLDRFVTNLLRWQKRSGAFPYGEMLESVDTTAGVLGFLGDYRGSVNRHGIASRAMGYMMKAVETDEALRNPWLKKKGDVKIATMWLAGVAPYKHLFSKQELEYFEKMSRFVEDSIVDGRPNVQGTYRMQHPLIAALSILDSGAISPEKSEEVEQYVLDQQEGDGRFDIDVNWKDLMYKIYSSFGATALQTTSSFIITFVDRLDYPPNHDSIRWAYEFISEPHILTSRPIVNISTIYSDHYTNSPPSILGVINAKQSIERRSERTLPRHNREVVEHCLENPSENLLKTLRTAINLQQIKTKLEKFN